jgi:hypothetical protein
MTSSQTEQPPEQRLPYEKPSLKSISLVADQVLGVGCKMAAGVITDSGNPTGCTTNPCLLSGT